MDHRPAPSQSTPWNDPAARPPAASHESDASLLSTEASEWDSEPTAESGRRFNINQDGVLSARVERSDPEKKRGFWRRK